MSNVFYNGIPIDKVDFQKESEKELVLLEQNIAKIKDKLQNTNPESYDYQYWAIKMHDANKRLEIGMVSLS